MASHSKVPQTTTAPPATEPSPPPSAMFIGRPYTNPAVAGGQEHHNPADHAGPILPSPVLPTPVLPTPILSTVMRISSAARNMKRVRGSMDPISTWRKRYARRDHPDATPSSHDHADLLLRRLNSLVIKEDTVIGDDVNKSSTKETGSHLESLTIGENNVNGDDVSMSSTRETGC
ncbi:hypothetical protein A4X13_0g4890 [Tilletia indica]|uniref:Uncharacterized protein n=1 Tax=Tilletia indica TaxID=43049 RepID=A0A177TPK3_9BASI|nr:hypothetical protein A4X13_0g4890 [Tilletia indica]